MNWLELIGLAAVGYVVGKIITALWVEPLIERYWRKKS